MVIAVDIITAINIVFFLYYCYYYCNVYFYLLAVCDVIARENGAEDTGRGIESVARPYVSSAGFVYLFFFSKKRKPKINQPTKQPNKRTRTNNK